MSSAWRYAVGALLCALALAPRGAGAQETRTPSPATESAPAPESPPVVAPGHGSSLFFSPGEEQVGLAFLGQSIIGATVETAQTLHLGALVYYSAENWRLWIDERVYTPEDPANTLAGLRILAVTPHAVTLAVDGRTVTLKPNQSYDRAQGRVQEGR